VECLPAEKPWDVVSVTRRSSGVAPRACVRVYARVLVPPDLYSLLYIHTYMEHTHTLVRREGVYSLALSGAPVCGSPKLGITRGPRGAAEIPAGVPVAPLALASVVLQRGCTRLKAERRVPVGLRSTS